MPQLCPCWGLIEAYWNVNESGTFRVLTLPSGLIEAYWNVNNLNEVW